MMDNLKPALKWFTITSLWGQKNPITGITQYEG